MSVTPKRKPLPAPVSDRFSTFGLVRKLPIKLLRPVQYGNV